MISNKAYTLLTFIVLATSFWLLLKHDYIVDTAGRVVITAFMLWTSSFVISGLFLYLDKITFGKWALRSFKYSFIVLFCILIFEKCSSMRLH